MPSRYPALSLFLVCLVGCTSFRTTALYRLDNDSVVPECTNKRLKGLPVKLKVPSHVAVTIYEQQVLLAEDSAVTNVIKQKAKDAAEKRAGAQSELDNQKATIDDVKHDIVLENETVTKATMIRDGSTDPEVKKAQNAVIEEHTKKIANLEISQKQEEAKISALEVALADADNAYKAAKERASTPKNALVSFDPPQLMVETELMYTDKVFLVDFRRPAGGMLDLKEARMDDEQYFAKIQAEVTERTISDVSGAITTLKGPLTGFLPKKVNSATPTSAITPDGEVIEGVDFQKSVVAFQRFDISEPDWEIAFQEFVNQHLGVCTTQMPVPPMPMADQGALRLHEAP